MTETKSEVKDEAYWICPFCPKLFLDETYLGNGLHKSAGGESKFDEHVRTVHHKVRGRIYIWEDVELRSGAMPT